MKKFLQSFKYARNGAKILAKSERNFRILLVCLAVTLIVGFGLDYYGQHLTRFEWAIIWGAIGLTLVSEALNTAIEKLVDLLHPEQHPKAGEIKDMAAAATMIASVIAIIIGCYILLPRITAAIFLN
jgi:diacylglycerol kinase